MRSILSKTLLNDLLMQPVDINTSPNILDANGRPSVVPITNFLLRPNPQENKAFPYLIESFPGLDVKSELNGKSRGAAYNYAKDSIYRVSGSKLYKESSSISEQVTIPNRDRVRMDGNANFQVICSGGVGYYWNDKELTQIRNWKKGEENAPPESTNYDLSGMIDVTFHLDFFLFIQKGKSGFLKTSVFREDRPDAIYAINGNPQESKADLALGITVLDGRPLLLSKRTARFFRYTGQDYSEIQNSRVEYGIAGTGCYCGRDETTIYTVGSPTTKESQQEIGVYILATGGVQPIHTDFILKRIKESKVDDIKIEQCQIDGYKTLLMHLTDETFCYIENVEKWVKLSSTKYGRNYQAIDFINNTSTKKWTCAGKENNNLFSLELSSSLQAGKAALHRLPMQTLHKQSNLRRVKINKFNFLVYSNKSVLIESMRVLQSIDGVKYMDATWQEYKRPYNLLTMPCFRRWGMISTAQGTSYLLEFLPVTVAAFSGFEVELL